MTQMEILAAAVAVVAVPTAAPRMAALEQLDKVPQVAAEKAVAVLISAAAAVVLVALERLLLDQHLALVVLAC